jgi:hypothetical protein
MSNRSPLRPALAGLLVALAFALAPGLAQAMKIVVHVKEKAIHVECAHGAQPVKWLGDVALGRYDNSGGISLGKPKAIKKEDGTVLDMKAVVKNVLRDGDHVWVEFRDPGSP